MSKKVPEVIMRAFAKNGKLVFENNQDVNYYCIEHDQEALLIHIEPEVQTSKKMKMYSFYYRVILNCALIGYTSRGYEGLDTVTCDYMLKAEFSKDFVKKPGGGYHVIILDKNKMTVPRLHKYLSDCIFFIETELQVNIPDSETYKLNKLTGHTFTKIDTHEKRD